jgi:acetyltransferase-like isoleucine patch superfamily enzyme
MRNTHLDLIDRLKKLYKYLRDEMWSKKNRELPLDELIFDRWEKARRLGFGKGTSVYHNSYIYGNVKVGENTWIGPFTVLDGEGILEIGDSCSISSGVQIYTHNSVKWAISGGKEFYEKKTVKIGNCCFIGANSVIKDGVSIGDHSVVGACSFVNKEVPPYSIVAGTPAKIVGNVVVDDKGNISFKYNKEQPAIQ